MRYRPFTRSGLSASALTLVLEDAPAREADRIKLIRAALESGVNSFELATAHPEVAATLANAIAAVGRRALVLSLRVGRPGEGGEADFAPASLIAHAAKALEQTQVEHFDAVILDEPQAGELSPEAIDALQQLRQQGATRMIGLSGGGAAVDSYMAARSFDLLATTFNMKSGWPERNRIKSAVAHGVTVLGEGYEIEPAKRVKIVDEIKGLGRLFKKPEAPLGHSYDFMRETAGWTAAQIGLAFALTEPCLASVRVHARSAEALESLAQAVERELPAGVAAQIEMARFAEVA